VSEPTNPPRRGAFALAVAALLGLHLLCFNHFMPLAVWWTDQPILGVDYETHVAQVWRAIEGLDGWGRSWVYDPHLLAGTPAGVIFDADNKGWEVWTWLLHRLGVPQGLAFNLFAVAAHWLLLPVVFLSARLFGLARAPALAATAMASLLWYFDSFAHWCWWVGMTAYAFASYLCLLPLALFCRWLQTRKLWLALATGLTLGLAHLVHPYSFFILAAPMLALYARSARSLGVRGHLTVLAIVAATLAINGWWLAVSLRFWHYILDSGYFGLSGLQFAVADVLELVLDSATSGLIGNRTGFRLLFLATCAIGLALWRRERDPRWLPFAAAVITLLVLSYLGAYTWLFRQIQPYRHVLPLAFVAVIPAAAAIDAAIRRGALRNLTLAPKLALGLLAIPAAQHLVADVTYYTPSLLPRLAPLYNNGWLPITTQGFPAQPDYRHHVVTADHDQLPAWVRAHDDGQSRFLVEEPSLGEQLSWRTEAQILGGFLYRNLEHSHANLFRRRKEGIASDDELRAYFETYAVSHVIITSKHKSWERRPNVLELVATIGQHRIFRTKIAPRLIAEGGGRVTASTNLLRVTGSDPSKDLVLRYHWMETLRCSPDCELRRVPVDSFDTVGFIKIPAPHPADLEVRNAYP
jgi:hypothetical protein